MRKHLIAANWKMFKTPTEANAFLTTFLPLVSQQSHTEIVLCPAMTSLAATIAAAAGSNAHVGAQTMHWLDSGAYTGETSPTMLKAIGATHVLIGHSERRQYFNETDTTVNLKLKAALAHGLIPIVCVGEHLEERESDLTAKVLELQTAVALEGIDAATAAPIVFAYEPVYHRHRAHRHPADRRAGTQAHPQPDRLIPHPGHRCLNPHPVRWLRQAR